MTNTFQYFLRTPWKRSRHTITHWSRSGPEVCVTCRCGREDTVLVPEGVQCWVVGDRDLWKRDRERGGESMSVCLWTWACRCPPAHSATAPGSCRFLSICIPLIKIVLKIMAHSNKQHHDQRPWTLMPGNGLIKQSFYTFSLYHSYKLKSDTLKEPDNFKVCLKNILFKTLTEMSWKRFRCLNNLSHKHNKQEQHMDTFLTKLIEV